jgi:hypothetical protein
MTTNDESDGTMPAAIREADPSHTLAAALEGYSDVYLQCRGVQHRWNVTEDLHISERTEDGNLVERIFECENCETQRKDRFMMRMDRWQVNRLEVLGAQYKYPEDYLMSEMGLAEHPREILRFEQLRRTLGPRKLNAAKKAAQAPQAS